MPPRRNLVTAFVLVLIGLLLVVGAFYFTRSTPPRVTVQDLPPPRPAASPAPQQMETVMPKRTPPRATGMDPGIRQMTDELESPGGNAQRDVHIISNLMDEYRRAFQGNPAGDNADITAAMVGDPSGPGRFLPNSGTLIRGGQLVDRWGTPYWFHPNSSSQMEVRSAGPDKNLFTPDDIVHNPSPSGLGATPTVQEEPP